MLLLNLFDYVFSKCMIIAKRIFQKISHDIVYGTKTTGISRLLGALGHFGPLNTEIELREKKRIDRPDIINQIYKLSSEGSV